MTITIPPITWSGLCLGTTLGIVATLAFGFYISTTMKKPKAQEDIPFEQAMVLPTKGDREVN